MMTVGSSPAALKMEAVRDVVVVLPCVRHRDARAQAHQFGQHFRAGNDGDAPGARGLTSGLSSPTAEERTTTCGVPRFSAAWPMRISAPSARSWRTVAPSAMSEPCTLYPRFSSTSAMPAHARSADADHVYGLDFGIHPRVLLWKDIQAFRSRARARISSATASAA